MFLRDGENKRQRDSLNIFAAYDYTLNRLRIEKLNTALSRLAEQTFLLPP
jgi:hypothetical protein